MKNRSDTHPKRVNSHPEETAHLLVLQAHQNRDMLQSKRFFGYVWNLFRRTGIYTVWKSILTYLRGARTVALILRVITVLFSFLQTGTLVILSTVLLLILLPILLFTMIVTLLTAAVQARKANRQMKRLLLNQKICVFFLPRESHPYFEQTVRTFAKRQDTAVLLCSPYWIISRGICSKGAFCTVRRECENVYLVRRYYFPSLKRNVLAGMDVTVIY